MKKITRAVIVLCAVLMLMSALTVAVSADAAQYVPNDFYEEHKSDCRQSNENFYINGEEGYVGFYVSPEHKEPFKYVLNGDTVNVDYVYYPSYPDVDNGRWGMVRYDREKYGAAPVGTKYMWIKMRDLKKTYDRSQFAYEHEFEDRNYTLKFENDDIVVYSYPGSGRSSQWQDYTAECTVNYAYIDEDGREWIYLTREYEHQRVYAWHCVTDPTNADLPLVEYPVDLIPPAAKTPVAVDVAAVAAIIATASAVSVATVVVVWKKRRKN